jgi:hypothetical protein
VLRIYLLFIVLYTFYNQCSLEILRSGSAVLLVMVIAVCVPFTDAWNAIPFLAGDEHRSFTKVD